jgi:hypothetical protein
MGQIYVTGNYADFTYARNFSFADGGVSEITEAMTAVSAQWYGVLNSFWSSQGATQQTNTRNLVYNLLIAWYLADMFPMALANVGANGGMPVVKKSIGGVDITFTQYKIQEEMKVLTTNTFGLRALSMILTAPERFGMLGSTNSIFPQPDTGVPPLPI